MNMVVMIPPVKPSKIMTVLLRSPKGTMSPKPTVENTTTLNVSLLSLILRITTIG